MVLLKKTGCEQCSSNCLIGSQTLPVTSHTCLALEEEVLLSLVEAIRSSRIIDWHANSRITSKFNVPHVWLDWMRIVLGDPSLGECYAGRKESA